jgi:hypothetical protein
MIVRNLLLIFVNINAVYSSYRSQHLPSATASSSSRSSLQTSRPVVSKRFHQKQKLLESCREASRSRGQEMIELFKTKVKEAIPYLLLKSFRFTLTGRLETFFHTFGMAASEASRATTTTDMNGKTISRRPSTVSILSTDLWNEIADFLWFDFINFQKQNAISDLITRQILDIFPSSSFPFAVNFVVSPSLRDRIHISNVLDKDGKEKNFIFLNDHLLVIEIGENNNESLADALESKIQNYCLISNRDDFLVKRFLGGRRTYPYLLPAFRRLLIPLLSIQCDYL